VLYYYTQLPPDDRWHELVVNISESRYKVYSRRGFFLGKTAASSALARGMEKMPVQMVDPGVLKVNAMAALNEVASLPAEPKPIDASTREAAAAIAPATQSKPATIKIDARLVEVPVYVESTDGREPPNFLDKDFQVYEDSRRREIAFFSSIRMEDVPKARDLAMEKADTGVLQGKINLAASEAQDLEFGRYYLVFDDLMADEGPFLRAKNATEEIIRKYASPLQPISVYFTSRGRATNSGTTQIEALLGEVRKIGFQSNRSAAQRGGIDLPLAFTIDTGGTGSDAALTGELLIAERERLEYENRLGRVTGAGDQARNQPVIQRMLATEVSDVILAHANRLRRTLDGLGQAINIAVADPGKSSKTMIFISSGFYTGRGTQYDATNTLENMIATAKRAGIRIFAMDTTVAAEEFMGRSAASGSMQLLKPNLNVTTTSLQSERIASLDTLARGTGGKRLQSDNNISAAIQPAISLGRLYYLAFVSRLPEDGRYHKINVTVSSRSVRVRARQGYYARPVPRLKT
jgi:VWFA-related protein